MTVDWPLLRHMLLCRCGGRCEHCGRPLLERHDRWEAHHRRLEGQRGPAVLSNLLALRIDCHDLVHDQPATAMLLGLIVPSWADWQNIPVTLSSGRIITLDDHGGITCNGWNPTAPLLVA